MGEINPDLSFEKLPVGLQLAFLVMDVSWLSLGASLASCQRIAVLAYMSLSDYSYADLVVRGSHNASKFQGLHIFG